MKEKGHDLRKKKKKQRYMPHFNLGMGTSI
jgi:hypothetical protein